MENGKRTENIIKWKHKSKFKCGRKKENRSTLTEHDDDLVYIVLVGLVFFYFAICLINVCLINVCLINMYIYGMY